MPAVQAIVTTTTNVKEAMQTFAKTHKLPVELLSLDIIAFNTFYRIAPSKQWIKIDEERRAKILNSKNAGNPNLYLIEQYKIRIYKKELPTPFQSYLTLQTTKLKTKVFMLLKQNTILDENLSALPQLMEEIKRKLVLSGFFLGLYMMNLTKALQPLIEDLKQNKSMSEDYSILIAQGIIPSKNIPCQFTSHFLLKNEDTRRAYETGVDEGELILEYLYPQMGITGRDCQGKLLPAQGDPIKTCQLIYFDPNSIRSVDQNDRRYFYALKKGFVRFEDQQLLISNELQLELASFKATGSITLGEHRDVDLKIHQKDTSKDAINRGVSIEVSNVEIKGSVADNTSIIADQVSILSNTHKSSTIQAHSDANVNLHRGNLKAHIATIGKLEFGVVEADIVKVNEVLGGEIIAREIYIDILHSNAKLIASDIIEVKKIRGKNNSFTIAPSKVESLAKYIKETQEAIQNSEKNKKRLHQELDKLIKKMDSEYGAISLIQKEVADAVRQGKNQPILAATKVRQYGIDTEKSEELSQELQKTLSHLETLYDTAQKQQDSLANAKIIFHDYWDGSNQIFYEHPDSTKREKIIPEGFKKEIVYKDLDESQLITVSE